MNIDKTALLQRIEGMNAEMEGTAVTGWKLVPIEATPEMMKAAVIYSNGAAIYKNVSAAVLEIEESIYGESYRAMLAAAPVAPALQAQELSEKEIVAAIEGIYRMDHTNPYTFEMAISNAVQGAILKKFYVAPAPSLADLTDEQIVEVADSVGARSCLREWYITFAHAILVATRTQS